MARREPSIFGRLIALVSVALIVGVSVLITAAWYYALEAANQAYDRLLVGAAYQIAEAATIQDGILSVEPPTSAFELLALSERDRIFYKVVDPHGSTLTGYDDLQAGKADDLALNRPIVHDGVYKGEPVRVAVIARAFSDPLVQGRIEIVVAQTTEARAALARELTLRAAILVTIMSMLALGGNIYFTSKIAATDGLSFQQIAAIMTGSTQADYAAMMLKGGRSPDGNRSKSEWKNRG